MGICAKVSSSGHPSDTNLNVLRCSNNKKSSKQAIGPILIILVLARIARRWNQTGQKFAGQPDIARSFLPLSPTLLWTLATTTFLESSRRIALTGFPMVSRSISTIAAISLCLSALVYKVAFTNADAPELLAGYDLAELPWFSTLISLDLVAQARAAFLGLAISLVYVLFQRSRAHNLRQMDKQGL